MQWSVLDYTIITIHKVWRLLQDECLPGQPWSLSPSDWIFFPSFNYPWSYDRCCFTAALKFQRFISATQVRRKDEVKTKDGWLWHLELTGSLFCLFSVASEHPLELSSPFPFPSSLLFFFLALTKASWQTCSLKLNTMLRCKTTHFSKSKLAK